MLTANSLDVTDLSYVGTFTVSQPYGDVDVLRFTLTTGTIGALTMTAGCAAGITTVTTASAATLGGTTFDAVSLAVTVGGAPITFTVADPPTAFPSELHLTDVTIVATTLAADTLRAPSFTSEPATC